MGGTGFSVNNSVFLYRNVVQSATVTWSTTFSVDFTPSPQHRLVKTLTSEHNMFGSKRFRIYNVLALNAPDSEPAIRGFESSELDRYSE